MQLRAVATQRLMGSKGGWQSLAAVKVSVTGHDQTISQMTTSENNTEEL